MDGICGTGLEEEAYKGAEGIHEESKDYQIDDEEDRSSASHRGGSWSRETLVSRGTLGEI